jgi:hypothetical protein
MILDRDHVSCDDFVDCHAEIIVADIDFIGTRPIICGLYLQEDSDSKSSILSSIVVERNSRSQGTYVVPNDISVDIVSVI